MRRPAPGAIVSSMAAHTPDPSSAATGDPVVACDARSRITAWNAAAERVTGFPAAEVVGQPCWRVLGGVDEAGAAICHAGCGHGRRARSGCPAAGHDSLIRTRDGRRRVRLTTISLGDDERHPYLIVFEGEGEAVPTPPAGTVDGRGDQRLTARQRQVLTLLADGVSTRAVAGLLDLSESTVRNYIRDILIALHCHSRREAVRTARRLGLI